MLTTMRSRSRISRKLFTRLQDPGGEGHADRVSGLPFPSSPCYLQFGVQWALAAPGGGILGPGPEDTGAIPWFSGYRGTVQHRLPPKARLDDPSTPSVSRYNQHAGWQHLACGEQCANGLSGAQGQSAPPQQILRIGFLATSTMSNIHSILEEFREAALSNRDLGDKFERLFANYLTTDPLYIDKYSDVWLWR